ncbi:MAG: Uridine kinase [uncultured Acidimicrobiales bacterium]|uniref:Phosphoribulokinase n=1 Tax=uncultured Acidimicrobiales bacterium TaxID=310071 RepID=A0A6J4J8E6_9ACTN|nr:MAG: Uridine kinase [uncultured Acidimicrobiales bacterium]
MPDKEMNMARAGQSNGGSVSRPIMLAIAGDSGTGKTTITAGLVEALGRERITSIGVDDYHRYDREERKGLPFTPLHPRCNYIDIMEQHLQHLALGQPILKPVYDHDTGMLGRPEYVEPRDFVIVEGLLPLHTKTSMACFDATVYLDPPEEIRIKWKLSRDTKKRGYTEEQVREDLKRREPESAEFIRPQRSKADIVVRFAPIEERGESGGDPLSATLLLRPTISHPDLTNILGDDTREAMHLKLIRDEDGRPVDALHIHSYAEPEVTKKVEQAIWDELGLDVPVPDSLGRIDPETRDEPLALTQLILLYHLIQAKQG